MNRLQLSNPNWEPFALQRINQVIKTYGTSTSLPLCHQAYAVFDFDNTSSFFDIEDHLAIYLIEEFKFTISPTELYQVLTDGPFDIKSPLEENCPQLTLEHLAKDIVEQYALLKTQLIDTSLTTLKETPAYIIFSTKLLAHYRYAVKHNSHLTGENWLTYWFCGYTETTFQTLANKMISWALNLPIEKKTYSTAGLEEGLSGVVTITMEQGLRFPNEIKELYHILQANHISTYIVTASPELLGQVAASYFNVPVTQVLGMKIATEENGILQSRIVSDGFTTKKAGKVEAVKTIIAPLHQGRMPVLAFGDSTGDYDLLTIEELKLGVLFNRCEKDNTQKLIHQALKQYQTDTAKLVIQGRNENTATLLPTMKSIRLGTTKEILFANEKE